MILQCNEIRKTNSNLIVIGKTTVDNDKEDFDNDADDDDADHGDESEGEEFEQETAWICFLIPFYSLLFFLRYLSSLVKLCTRLSAYAKMTDIEFSHKALISFALSRALLIGLAWKR